jgi:hypothetical protein
VVSSHSGTPLGVRTSHEHFGPRDIPRPGPREYATTILPIVYSVTLGGTHARMSLFPETPGLESRNCPKTVLGGVLGLWELITPDCGVWSRRGLNQTCSPRRDLSNDISHSQFGGREEVDSRLLVVRSQTTSLTPGPSFAHNLSYRYSNDQCEAIFYIYASRTFQWHQEHLNARCFGPCCRALNIRESRRTPNPHFFQVLGFTPTLGQSRVATLTMGITDYTIFNWTNFRIKKGSNFGIIPIVVFWVNFHHLVTKKKIFTMIHTKEFCEKKSDKVTKFQGIIFEITIFRQ